VALGVELGLVLLGLVLDGSVLVLVPRVVLLALGVPPWADAPPLMLRSCHGTGTSLPSDERIAKAIRPLVGCSNTSSMRPASSPDVVFTCEPMIFVLRKCCCCPA
jgi:hypothetical protein